MIQFKAITLCFLFGLSSFSYAQSIKTNLVIQSDDTISLYSSGETWDFSLLHSFDDFYILDDLRFNPEDSYQIVHQSQIKLSPDNNYLAFTAVKFSSYESILVIYDIENGISQQIEITGLGQVLWSPNSDRLLLTPLDIYITSRYPILNQIYVYDLSDGLLHEIETERINLGNEYLWLPDSSQIIYSGFYEYCDTSSCRVTEDLYRFDLEDRTQHRLSDLSGQNLDDLGLRFLAGEGYRCQISHQIWSTQNERIYFSLDCRDSSDNIFSSLHSVALDGNYRFEWHLMDLDTDLINIQILDIFTSSLNDTIYVSIMGSKQESVGELTNIQGFWSVIRYHESIRDEAASRSFPDLSEPSVFSSDLSPDEKYISLAGGRIHGFTADADGYIVIIELETGDMTEYISDGIVCNQAWYDSQTFVYQQFDRLCNQIFSESNSIWLLDVDSGEYTEIFTQTEPSIWIISF